MQYLENNQTPSDQTKTSRFKKEYEAGTRNTKYSLGRTFASRVHVRIQIVDHEEVRLQWIETLSEYRGKGYASECLDWLCVLADAYGVTISLSPLQLDKNEGLDDLMLTAWYQRHGFVHQYQDEFKRLPKCSLTR